MFSFEELITNFFPERSEQERQVLLGKLENNSLNYTARDWAAINPLQLANEQVQLNLLYSLYQYQSDYYEGADSAILESLEDWSDKKIFFDFLTEPQNWFYQKYYAWLGFLNFEHQKSLRQDFLLGSRFLLLAVLSGKIEIIEKVRNYFAHYCFVNIYKEDSARFADDLLDNKNIIGDPDDNNNKSISDWIKMFENFKFDDTETKVEEFSRQFVQITKLVGPLKVALEYILVLYDALATNKIWKNIVDDKCLHEEKVESQPEVNVAETYLNFLKELPDLNQWLGSASEVAVWLKTQNVDFIKKLLITVKEKVNLLDENQLNLVISFGNILQEQKFINEELVYFNESDNQFHWNEKIFS